MRDGLVAYLHLLREDARAEYDVRRLMWAILAPHAKQDRPCPMPPDILTSE